MKPGAKTTEFWLTFGVTLSASLSAIFNESDTVKVISAVLAALSVAYYTRTRTRLKAKDQTP